MTEARAQCEGMDETSTGEARTQCEEERARVGASLKAQEALGRDEAATGEAAREVEAVQAALVAVKAAAAESLVKAHSAAAAAEQEYPHTSHSTPIPRTLARHPHTDAAECPPMPHIALFL